MEKFKFKGVPVTQPFLPPLEEFMPLLQQIWDNKQLTNNGPFHQKLEQDLMTHLGVEHLSLFSNGTLALITALQALDITGEVITTPYSFVATSHALVWNRIKPVFVDIDPVSMNLDPAKIEAAITDKTTAILPVHVYGVPCATEAIREIADRHGLKVIYDAAHAFGVRHHGKSLLLDGDLSVLSFHATKVFNTFEGGAIVCHSKEMKQRIDHLKNFGFVDEINVVTAGINGKMNEVQAAMGVLQLQYIDGLIAARKTIYQRYTNALSGVPGIELHMPPDNTEWNYGYFPICVDPSFAVSRDGLYDVFRKNEIIVRRYFYPLICDFAAYKDERLELAGLDIAREKAEQVLCLPLYPNLAQEDQDRIIGIILDLAGR